MKQHHSGHHRNSTHGFHDLHKGLKHHSAKDGDSDPSMKLPGRPTVNDEAVRKNVAKNPSSGDRHV